ncbi:hypothetical protein BWZ43_22840 [Heyndrickxia oleronia]|nr:hypothetical protein BWZ43_22840 [Heyndrickxia oleronia]
MITFGSLIVAVITIVISLEKRK